MSLPPLLKSMDILDRFRLSLSIFLSSLFPFPNPFSLLPLSRADPSPHYHHPRPLPQHRLPIPHHLKPFLLLSFLFLAQPICISSFSQSCLRVAFHPLHYQLAFRHLVNGKRNPPPSALFSNIGKYPTIYLSIPGLNHRKRLPLTPDYLLIIAVNHLLSIHRLCPVVDFQIYRDIITLNVGIVPSPRLCRYMEPAWLLA